MTKRKIQKTFIENGFGFPIVLLNVPMIKVRGEWTPKINYNVLTLAVLRALCEKPTKLTGNEVSFIRQHFEMTLQQFAQRFAVSHVAVLKWEGAKDKSTAMTWSTEKDLRLFVLSKISAQATELAELYKNLAVFKPKQKYIVKVDVDDIAAV
jgi:hypothetical protein